jgi:hypothetical protein
MHADMGGARQDLAPRPPATHAVGRAGVRLMTISTARTARSMRLPVLAPITGVVVEKDVVAGSAFAAGQGCTASRPTIPRG